ncbi:ion transporter [bacterium]|nr:ion transporter [bacterium]
MEKHSNITNKKSNKSNKSKEKNGVFEKNTNNINKKSDFLDKKNSSIDTNSVELSKEKELSENLPLEKNRNRASSEKYSKLKQKLYKIIFESDTVGGKLFDILLIVAIIISVIVAFFDSFDDASPILYFFEWFFTTLFTIEYFARVWIVKKPSKYIFSFFGIIDFLSILPAYLSIFITGTHYLIVVRVLRILRVFRIFKLARYLQEANIIVKALKHSFPKIVVFMTAVASLIVVMGSIMYIVEGPENGFTSITKSIYWAIVTITTVGYGDIAPKTPIGQAISSLVMIVGYSIIAIPTGIVSAEFIQSSIQKQTNKVCRSCSKEGHDIDAEYCKYCGYKL